MHLRLEKFRPSFSGGYVIWYIAEGLRQITTITPKARLGQTDLNFWARKSRGNENSVEVRVSDHGTLLVNYGIFLVRLISFIDVMSWF